MSSSKLESSAMRHKVQFDLDLHFKDNKVFIFWASVPEALESEMESGMLRSFHYFVMSEFNLSRFM